MCDDTECIFTDEVQLLTPDEAALHSFKQLWMKVVRSINRAAIKYVPDEGSCLSVLVEDLAVLPIKLLPSLKRRLLEAGWEVTGYSHDNGVVFLSVIPDQLQVEIAQHCNNGCQRCTECKQYDCCDNMHHDNKDRFFRDSAVTISRNIMAKWKSKLQDQDQG